MAAGLQALQNASRTTGACTSRESPQCEASDDSSICEDCRVNQPLLELGSHSTINLAADNEIKRRIPISAWMTAYVLIVGRSRYPTVPLDRSINQAPQKAERPRSLLRTRHRPRILERRLRSEAATRVLEHA